MAARRRRRTQGAHGGAARAGKRHKVEAKPNAKREAGDQKGVHPEDETESSQPRVTIDLRTLNHCRRLGSLAPGVRKTLARVEVKNDRIC